MRRPLSILVIATVLLSPMAPGTLEGASRSMTLPSDGPSLEIDLRIHLEGLESVWSGRIAFDRLDLHSDPISFVEDAGERIEPPELNREEIDLARRWFVALRVLGRFTIRQAIHLIDDPVFD